MIKVCIQGILLLCAAFPVALLASTPKQYLLDGREVVAKVLTPFPGVLRNSRLLLRLDLSGKAYVSSQLTPPHSLMGGPASLQSNGDLTIFGRRYEWSQSVPSACLVVSGSSSGCDIKILGPLIPDEDALGSGWVDEEARLVVAQLRGHLRRPDELLEKSSPCAKNSQLRQRHIADRFLAEFLRLNGGLLPFVTDPALHQELEKAVDAGIEHLLQTARPSSLTSYTECYGGLDLITPLLVVRALDEHYRLRPKPEILLYFQRLWPNLMAERAIDAFGARNAAGVLNCANCFAAYLHIAVVMESHGIPALQPFTMSGLLSLLDGQVLERGKVCVDKGGEFVLAYGGWVHSRDECSQNIGYHNFIIGALIAAGSYLRSHGQCSVAVCERIDLSLIAGLRWIADLSAGSDGGLLFDRAPGSSNVRSIAGAGNVTGADTAFRIIEVLGDVEPRIRQRMVGVLLESSKRRRGRFTALPSYLRSLTAYSRFGE